MPDIATVWDRAEARGDWQRSGPALHLILDSAGAPILDDLNNPLLDAATVYTPGQGLLAGGDLYTATLISLFTDAEAGTDDVVPDGSNDPRGWWGGPVGSKIWLRLRSKRTPALLELVRRDILDALRWMIDDGVAARIDAATEFRGSATLAASVTITRQDGTSVPLSYEWAWKGE